MKTLFQYAFVQKLKHYGIGLAVLASFIGATWFVSTNAFFAGTTPEMVQTEIDNRIVAMKTELVDMEIERLQSRKRVSKKTIRELKKQINPEVDNTKVLAEIQVMNNHIQLANKKIEYLNAGGSYWEIKLVESEIKPDSVGK